MSTEAADPVVADTVEAAQAVFGEEIAAIYVLGSLAHGGFAPRVSDVDIAVVLDRTGADTAARIGAVQDRVIARGSTPLAERLSVFWGDWRMVRTGEGEFARLGPVDRLDLLDHGRLLLGADQREPGVRPTPQELTAMSAEMILAKFTEPYIARLAETDELVAGGERAVTKAILFPVRFRYTLATGRIGLNDDAARWYAAEGLPGGTLALQALEWRREGLAGGEPVSPLLDADLLALHAECLDAYAEHLDRIGEVSLATVMSARASLAQVAVGDAR